MVSAQHVSWEPSRPREQAERALMSFVVRDFRGRGFTSHDFSHQRLVEIPVNRQLARVEGAAD